MLDLKSLLDLLELEHVEALADGDDAEGAIRAIA